MKISTYVDTEWLRQAPYIAALVRKAGGRIELSLADVALSDNGRLSIYRDEVKQHLVFVVDDVPVRVP